MKTKIILVAMLASATSAVSAGPGPAWAWEAGKITNNGSVQIKSTNGATTYDAVQNPVGAVAKTNQSALTQPPTVIIQATAGGYAETIPMLVSSSATLTCPTGYTTLFARNGTGVPTQTSGGWFNVGGSRWSLVIFWDSSSANYKMSWAADTQMTIWFYNTTLPAVNPVNIQQGGTGYAWSAALCGK